MLAQVIASFVRVVTVGVTALPIRRVAARGMAACVLVALAGCGGGPPTAVKPVGPHRVTGGNVRFALPVGERPSYILPLPPSSGYNVVNISQFQHLMYRPLYWFGGGSYPSLNPQLSLAQPPVYSFGNKVVLIRLNNYMWSDGEAVTSRDVIFWLNLLEANKAHWGGYTAGGFPDNVLSYSAPTSDVVVLHLTDAVNPTWFTYNDLSQIVPLPLAWDVRSPWETAPAASSTTAADMTPGGAQAVYAYLNKTAADLSHAPSSLIWGVVDGPWRLAGVGASGEIRLVPNDSYSGPDKPSLSSFTEVPFSSLSQEVHALSTGHVDYGYLPPPAQAPPRLAAHVPPVVLRPWQSYGIGYMAYNFASPTMGPVFAQLYFRQAFQHLMHPSLWVRSIWRGQAVASYSPVPTQPRGVFTGSAPVANPYPYDLTAARALLAQHGWAIHPGGTDACVRPGPGPSQCGPGIPRGLPLVIQVTYGSGSPGVAAEMAAVSASASQVGIKLAVSPRQNSAVEATLSGCAADHRACRWQMEVPASGWEFALHHYPSAGSLVGSGGASNGGGYASAQGDALLAEAQTGTDGSSTLGAFAQYMADDLPVAYLPAPYHQVSVVAADLRGVSQDIYLSLTPEQWYLVK